MKRFLFIPLMLLAMMLMAACGGSDNDPIIPEDPEQPVEPTPGEDPEQPVPGDIAIYAPWGNVAIFCKSWSQSNDLIKIGHIDGNGIETLSVAGDITVKFEKR